MLTKKKKNQDRGSSQSGGLKNPFSRSKKTKDGAEYSRLDEEGSGMEGYVNEGFEYEESDGSLQPDTATSANEGSAPAASAGNAQEGNPETTRQKVALVTPVLSNINETVRSLEESLYAFENEGQKENNKLFREISEGLLEVQNTILRAADQISIQDGSITSIEELVQALESGAGTGKEVDEIMRKLVAGGNSSVIGKLSELLAKSRNYERKRAQQGRDFNITRNFDNTQSTANRVLGKVGRQVGNAAGNLAGTAVAAVTSPFVTPVGGAAAGFGTKKAVQLATDEAVDTLQKKVNASSESTEDDAEVYDPLLGGVVVEKGKVQSTKDKITGKVTNLIETVKDKKKGIPEIKRLLKENGSRMATDAALTAAVEAAGAVDPTGVVLEGAINYVASETGNQLYGEQDQSNLNKIKRTININDVGSLNDNLGSLLTDLDELSKTYDRLQMGEPVE